MNLRFDEEKQVFTSTYFLNTILKSYPIYYYDDYYRIKDFKIFKVIDENGNLLNYLDNKGNSF